MKTKKEPVGLLTYFLYSLLLGFLGVFIFKSCSKPTKEEIRVENPINEVTKVELERCKIDLEEYKTCCQDCLTDRVTKAVNMKSR